MVRVIKDQDVGELLTVTESIPLMETVFRQFAEGNAKSPPRVRMLSEPMDTGGQYWSNVHVGCVPAFDAAAVRVGSKALRSRQADRVDTRSARDWGLIYVYRMATGALMGIVQEYTLSAIRVAATTALTVDLLARPEVASVGLFGTGHQALYNVLGLCQVRPIRLVKVYSPSAEHRGEFAAEIERRLGIACTVVDTPRQVVSGVDIISCATNANRPVFSGEWLEPGQLVTAIVNSDVNMFRTELDSVTFERGDAVVINDWESVHANKQTELLDLLADGRVRRESVYELGDLLQSRAEAQSTPNNIVVYKNNTGLAIQFAAACAVILEKAAQQGKGTELPDELFFAETGGG